MLTVTFDNQALPTSAIGASSDAALQEVCTQFEALVFAQMLGAMRQSVATDGLIPRGQGEQLFQQMLDQEYAQQISRTHSTGLAALLYRQLSVRPPTHSETV